MMHTFLYSDDSNQPAKSTEYILNKSKCNGFGFIVIFCMKILFFHS